MKNISPMTTIEEHAQRALDILRTGNDGDPVYVECRSVYMGIHGNPSILSMLKQKRQVAQALTLLLSYETITDIDIRQEIASIAYFLVSDAIKDEPTNRNLYKDRLQIVICNKEAFGYTVSQAINPDMGIMDFIMRFHQFDKRDALVKMEMYDFSVGGHALIHMAKLFTDEFMEIMTNIMNGMLGENADIDDIIAEGEKIHDDVYKHLHNKIIIEKDLDF